MAQVGEQQVAHLDTRLLIVNKTLVSTMNALAHLRYLVAILTELSSCVACLTSGMLSHKENVDALDKYMRVLADHMVNPLVFLPDGLHHILVKVKMM